MKHIRVMVLLSTLCSATLLKTAENDATVRIRAYPLKREFAGRVELILNAIAGSKNVTKRFGGGLEAKAPLVPRHPQDDLEQRRADIQHGLDQLELISMWVAYWPDNNKQPTKKRLRHNI